MDDNMEYKRHLADLITCAISTQCPSIGTPGIEEIRDDIGNIVACVDYDDSNRVIFCAETWQALEHAFIHWCNHEAIRHDGKVGIAPF